MQARLVQVHLPLLLLAGRQPLGAEEGGGEGGEEEGGRDKEGEEEQGGEAMPLQESQHSRGRLHTV